MLTAKNANEKLRNEFGKQKIKDKKSSVLLKEKTAEILNSSLDIYLDEAIQRARRFNIEAENKRHLIVPYELLNLDQHFSVEKRKIQEATGKSIFEINDSIRTLVDEKMRARGFKELSNTKDPEKYWIAANITGISVASIAFILGLASFIIGIIFYKFPFLLKSSIVVFALAVIAFFVGMAWNMITDNIAEDIWEKI
ncbi:hypothetical protein [Lactobacillus johnsonii]|uniref:Uncharacterized protein n=1 Tax=Lactobacillus johnsonii TaxID=33959 RepID=A0A9X4XAX6_LACJH|nr:hypothetical protein [Lactobacillus johnsonii]MTE03640.1 hypothetical protein [Lactobacillus johnsonii]